MSNLAMDDMMVTRYDPPVQPVAEDSLSGNADLSDHDIDLYGAPRPVRMIMIPQPGGIESCPLKKSGECPDGCEVCVDFAEQMQHGDTEK